MASDVRRHRGGPKAVPPALEALLEGDPATLAWENSLGGATWEVGAGERRRFLKWSPPATGIDLTAEVERLRWAGRWAPVPVVLATGAVEGGTWMVTAALDGRNAVDPRWSARPAEATRAIGLALRAFHDALPLDGCPFDWSAAARIADARRRAAAGLIEPSAWHPSHRHLSVAGALRALGDPPPVDRAVVCHGDTCSPNFLIAEDGSPSGVVDCGSLGVADRWADLAIATWAVGWNYGPGWEGAVLDAYGVEPDPARTAWYRLLWDLGP